MEIEVKDFDLKSTILSGACFRVIEETDGRQRLRESQ